MTNATRDMLLAVLAELPESVEQGGCLAIGVGGVHSDSYAEGDACRFCGLRLSDQAVMSAYLHPLPTSAEYEMRAYRDPEFYAVLATSEYHEHWVMRSNSRLRFLRDADAMEFARSRGFIEEGF